MIKYSEDSFYLELIEDFKLWDLSGADAFSTKIQTILASKTLGADSVLSCLLKAVFDSDLNICRIFKEYIFNANLFVDSKPDLNDSFRKISDSQNNSFKQTNVSNFAKLCFALQSFTGLILRSSLELEVLHSTWQCINLIAAKNKLYRRFNIAFLLLVHVVSKKNTCNFDELLKRITASAFQQINDNYVPVSKYPLWDTFHTEWLNSLGIKTVKSHKAAYAQFKTYLEKHNFPDNPKAYLSNKREIEFYSFINELEIQSKVDYFILITKFTDWLIEEHMNGEGVSIASNNQLEKLKKSAKNVRNSLSESNKELMPISWVQKCKEILSENDYAWPKSLSWQYFTKFPNGKKTRTWSPTITFLYLFLFEIPIRKIQAQQLDSGEGDSEHFNLATNNWEANSGKHANYWTKHKTKKNQRGVITRLEKHLNSDAGLYINTNKIKDSANDFDESSGYVMPWHNHAAFKIIDDMRKWNEEFNPVSAPLKFEDVPSNCWPTELSSFALKNSPARFYLFRNACGENPAAPTSDANLFKFWHQLMQELERRLIADGQNVKIVLNYDRNNIPSKSIFTPHGLRVTGLSSLHQQGVPIEILSKLIAGHASILMTLHYIKYAPGKISEVLNEAKLKADLNSQNDFINRLHNSNEQEIQRFAVGNSENAIQIHLNKTQLGGRTSYTGSTIGLCPNNGTGCNTGGPIIKKNGDIKDTQYGPVPGGPSNCACCRYLITGTPWLTNLWLEGQRKLVEAQAIAKSISGLRDKINSLEERKFEFENNDASEEVLKPLRMEISALHNSLESKSKLLNEILTSSHAIHNLVEKIKCVASEPEPTEKGYSLIINADNSSPVEYHVASRFETINILVNASRIWKHHDDEDLELMRNKFIDEIMWTCDMTPISFSPLSLAEKKVAHDAVSNFLLTNVSNFELLQLEAGHLTLENLGLTEPLQKIIKFLEPVLTNKTSLLKDILNAPNHIS